MFSHFDLPIMQRDGDRNPLRKRARPAGENNTCGPLTTTNSTKELTMAGANHNAPTYFRDCFFSPQSSSQSGRLVPHVRLTDMAPPVMYLWTKLSGRWIEAAGFDPEQRLQIEVSHKRLVITPIEDAEGDHCVRHDRPDDDPATGRQLESVMAGEAQ
ncbi:SymE family type I addiction module toxin [Burkholderia cenocepacia]|uniref:SymE family type I addiction module toxin n=1 Tax=Burkholderia cenocepacia TaxID=95486 RepID=UPI001FC865D2|nr:SymE family type I addiction module toxin [Burkholderia cenocepacia]